MLADRISAEPRPQWPDAPHTLDPDLMHPRAVEMAQAMREGNTTYRQLAGEGFSDSEIKRFAADARTLARSQSSRQMAPGGDLLSEMVDKAAAAVFGQPPLPRGTAETQALTLAWGAYCRAVNAYIIDPWPSQRERCLSALRTYLTRHTKAGDAVVRHVVAEVETRLPRKAGETARATGETH